MTIQEADVLKTIEAASLHDGNGTIIPFVEYLAGVNSGLYNPAIDSFVNTQRRIKSEHQAPGDQKPNQKSGAAGPNKGSSQVGKGGEIFFRRIIERFADQMVDNMTSDWKDKPVEYKLAVMAPFLKSYDLALSGEVDLASFIEKFVVASGQMKLLQEFVSILNKGSTQSATKNNEMNTAKQDPSRENPPADFSKADVDREIELNILKMKMRDERIRKLNNGHQEVRKVEVAKARQSGTDKRSCAPIP